MIFPTILRKSIRTRLLITLLGLVTVTVILISLLGVINIFTAGRNAERVGNVTLREQAEEYLINLTKVTAEKHDLGCRLSAPIGQFWVREIGVKKLLV